MNLQNFQILADTLRANPEHYNLKHWYKSGQVNKSTTPPGEEFSHCGSAACLGGWINYITNNRTNVNNELICWSDQEHAAKWLGISDYQAEHLFVPRNTTDQDYIMFWTEAYEAGTTSTPEPYTTPVNEVADMLEAFAKGELKLS